MLLLANALLYYFGILILWHFKTNEEINPQPCTLSLYVLMRPLYTISKANSAQLISNLNRPKFTL